MRQSVPNLIAPGILPFSQCLRTEIGESLKRSANSRTVRYLDPDAIGVYFDLGLGPGVLPGSFLWLANQLTPLCERLNEIPLTLARDLGCAIDGYVAIRMGNGGLLDAEQSLLHCALRWHVAITTRLAEVAMFTHP